MTIQVFIQNEAGSDQKNYRDEKRLVWQRAVTVSRAYPYPYGFIVDTAADDGGVLACGCAQLIGSVRSAFLPSTVAE